MGFFDWFKSNPTKDNMKKAAKAYKRIMNFTKADKTKLTDSEEMDAGFLDAHSDVIDAYIRDFGNKKEENSDIDALLQAYYKRHQDKKPAPVAPVQEAQNADDAKKAVEQVEQKDAAASGKEEAPKTEDQEKAKKAEKDKVTTKEERSKLSGELGAVLADTELNIENDDSEEEHKALNEGISPSAMKGLKEISCWMLRNGAKTGAYSGNDKIRFVTQGILKEDARVKLFAYYLVENDMVGESNPDTLKIALATSQTDYVPSLAGFKDKMIASKFKFWKRFNASHFNWTKLGEAIRLALKNRDMMSGFSTLGGHEVSSSDAGDVEEDTGTDQAQDQASTQSSEDQGKAQDPANVSPAKAQEAAEKAKEKSKSKPENPEVEKLKAAAKARAEKLSEYIEAGKVLMKLQEEFSNNPNTDTMNKKARINSQLAILAMLFQDLEDCDNSVQDVYTTLSQSEFQDTPEAEEEESTAEKIGNVTEALSDGIEKTELPQELMEGYNNFAQIFNAISPSWKLREIPDEKVNYMDALGPTGDILGLVGSALSTYNLVLDIINLHENKSTMTAGTLALSGLEVFSDAFGIISDVTEAALSLASVAEIPTAIVTGAMSAVSGGIDIIAGAAKIADTTMRKKKLTSAAGKLKDDSKAQKMARLGQRNASVGRNIAIAKTIKGGIDLVGGVLTATGVASIAGAVLTGVGSVISLATTAYSYFANKKTKKDTVDDYINMDKMMEILKKNLKDDEDVKLDDIKDQLRIEMAARLHFSSVDDLFENIINEYALYLYEHIFFNKGDKSKPLNADDKANEGYIELLKGFGAKPDFKKRKPGPKAIAEYLKKV